MYSASATPPSRNGVRAVRVVLPLPARARCSARRRRASARRHLGQVGQRPAEVLELQDTRDRRSLGGLDEQELGEEVVVVHRPIRQRVAEAPRVVELPRVGHLQVVVVGRRRSRTACGSSDRAARPGRCFRSGVPKSVSSSGMPASPAKLIAVERVVDVHLIVRAEPPRQRRRHLEAPRVVVPVAFLRLGADVEAIEHRSATEPPGGAERAAAQAASFRPPAEKS